MRAVLCSLVLLVMAGAGLASESVTVPWDEFRRLYRDSVRRQLLKELGGKREESVSSLDEATYSVKVSDGRAAVQVLISGHHVSGKPRTLRLFGSSAIVAKVEALKGGTLRSGDEGFSLLPAGVGQFQVSLSLVIPIDRDRRSQLLAFRVPTALKNTLALTLPDDLRLLEHPGLAGSDGRLLFAPTGKIQLRFGQRAAQAAGGKVEVDALTRLGFRGGKVLLVTWFQPGREVNRPLELKLPAGARYVGSSLQRDQVIARAGGILTLKLSAPDTAPFSVSCSLDRPAAGKSLALTLPDIVGNTARENFLIVDEPDGAEMKVSAKGLTAGVPASRLPRGLRVLRGLAGNCLLLPHGARLQLNIRTFRALEPPGVVVDCVEFFTAFEENGGELSVLRATVPAGAVPRLHLEAIPGAKIWSLRINGKKKAIYGNGKAGWILPLERNKPSKIELAFLRRGGKLKLRGMLEAILPATGLSARRLLFAVALPARVQLISAEGAVSPTRPKLLTPPQEFVGKRYFFARSFHKGGQLKVKLYYREPAKDKRED